MKTTETNFTPGPWESGTIQRHEDIYGDGKPIPVWSDCVVRPEGQFPHGLWVADCGMSTDPERIANAHLIAAAPDLYAALAECFRFLHETLGYDDDDDNDPLALAKKALAKARGEA
jgi:hypothetical protein